VGPVYRASFRVQRGNGIGSFFRGLLRFVKPLLYSGAKAVGKEALKTGSSIIPNMINRELEEPVCVSFKNRFIEAKNLEQKIKNMTGAGLSLKRKRKSKKSQSPSKRRNVIDIFTRSSNGVFKIRD